jgi:predicted ribosome quality control (RQC) complex YloA/Tae2 family protein
MIDWNEVEELLGAGYHPYRFKAGKYEYMALKKGRETRSLGAYDEEAWNQLISLHNIHRYGRRSPMEEKKTTPERAKPEVIVSKDTLSHIISQLDAGRTRVQIVTDWDYHPDVVNYAYERWLELKNPVGNEENRQSEPSEFERLQAQQTAFQAQLEALKNQLDEAEKRLNELEKARASVERRGRLLHATCHYAHDGKCTELNVIKAMGKQGEPEVEVDEYVCNSCLCYWRFE